jgi:hypothetical protein
MNTNRTLSLLACLVVGFSASSALAQGTINWRVIGGGGDESLLGDYTLTGTCGQIDAGEAMTAGAISLSGGFWIGDTTATCPADLTGTEENSLPDGGVDISDLLYFLANFEVGAYGADLDDGSGSSTPDGVVDIGDLLFFLGHFQGGC